MARKPLDYWEKRQTDLMKRLEKGTEKTINSLVQAYEQATKNINKEIVKIYNNFAKDAGLSKKVLTQLLSSRETEQYYKNLLQVIKNNITDENIKKKLLAKYNAPAYAYRISRYEQLQQNIDLELKKLANIEQQITEIRYVDTIKEGYYHNIYNVQKAIGVGFNFSQIDDKTINLLLNEKWTDNANFSQRIWKNSEKLGNYLRTHLTADTMSGKSIQKIAFEVSDFMNVGLYNATTLVRTEVNHFANEAEMLSYEELGIEKYRFIATLDNVTCKHCEELDNKIFDLNDRQPGKNYPPIHPNDRCTTVAVFDDDVTEELQRRSKDENGKTIFASQDMDYQQWYEKYVTNNNNGGIIKMQEKKTIKSAKTMKMWQNKGNIQIIKNLKSVNVEYLPVQKLDKKLTNKEVIERISGGDETKGSCSSVALTYVGNKNGLNVLDFRGGESQRFFSTPQNILEMCDELKIKYEMELNYNDTLGAMNLLNKVEEGKEYYLSTGTHATIVRKLNGKLQYLELQNKTDNGFKQFTSQILKNRFGCKQTHTIQGYKAKARSVLIDIDEFKNKKEFKEILGYINTEANKQLKGVNGSAK